MTRSGLSRFPAPRQRPSVRRGPEAPRDTPEGRAPVARLLEHRLTGPLVLVAVCAVVFLVGLGGPPLLDPDEGRHAEVAREMLVGGHWLAPTLDFAPYRDKPVLFYWLAAASMRLAGVNEWGARLPSALFACLGVLLTAWWGTRFFGRLTGITAGLLLATSGLYMGLGRFVLVDMTFAVLVSAAQFSGSAWLLSPPTRRPAAWPFFVLLALAVLTKGPLGLILPALTLGAFVARPARLQHAREAPLGRGLLLVLLLAGSCYAGRAAVDPAYLWEFLWRDNVGRFLAGKGGHIASPFAYLYWLPLVFLPWSLYLPSLLRRQRTAPASPARELCLLWVGTSFVFLSLSRGKLATYLLPLLPPLALLTADALAASLSRHPLDGFARRNHRAVLWISAALLVGAGPAAALFLHRYTPDLLGLALFAPAGLALWVPAAVWTKRGRHDLALAALAGCCVLYVTAGYALATPVLRHVYSLEEPARLVERLGEEAAVATWSARGHSLRFYTQREIDDLSDLSSAAAILSAGRPAVVLTKTRLVETLRRAARRPLFVWWRGQRKKALVANLAAP
jgi:4-amino-4-deoxy-L-arabinose transferase-like glycosyltransferase